jgi:hypothetical protein
MTNSTLKLVAQPIVLINQLFIMAMASSFAAVDAIPGSCNITFIPRGVDLTGE